MNRTTDFSATNATDEDTNILTFDGGMDEEEHDVNIGGAIFVPANDEFDEQVAKAQEQLEDLRRQQEEIEQQKNELEQLRVRQVEFQKGRVEMIENLQHALDVIDRDALDAEQRVEQYTNARESFTRHLDAIANLRPESWSREELKAELEDAAVQVEDARDDYKNTLEQLDANSPDYAPLPPLNQAADALPVFSEASLEPVAAELAATSALPENRNFGYWFRSGLAFTLPLMVFGCFSLMLVLLFG